MSCSFIRPTSGLDVVVVVAAGVVLTVVLDVTLEVLETLTAVEDELVVLAALAELLLDSTETLLSCDGSLADRPEAGLLEMPVKE